MTICKRSENEWITPSKSTEGGLHLVKRVAGVMTCDCNGFYYRGACCHVTAVVASLKPATTSDPLVLGIAAIFLAGRTPR